MKVAAFIFARGGSKGLPGKNIRLLAGKPLIAWSIEQALAVKRIDEVIVSTDSLEIAAIAQQYGARVPFIRPAELALDHTPEWLAWQHALNYVNEESNCLPESMVSIPTTAPLRLSSDIEKCLDEYERGGVDTVITVTESYRNPYFNMVKRNANGTVSLVNQSQSIIARRQDAPLFYDVATVCYVLNSKFVMTHNSIFDGRVKAVCIPDERAIDIDTLLDFQIAECLLNKKIGQSDDCS